MSCARVLLVGGGITSAVTASMLAETQPHLRLTVWDKARGAGGRMSTARSSRYPGASVDTGAQYISSAPALYSQHLEIYQALLASGVLKPANISMIQGMREDRLGEGERTEHFIVPDGMSSLVKHFFRQSGAELNFGRRVAEVNRRDSLWQVRTECGLEDVFDAVVLTMPVPQVLQMAGDMPHLISEAPGVRPGLEAVTYSTRFVLGLYYDGAVDLGVDWACKYVTDNPVIRFVSIDNMKREKTNIPGSILVHSTVPFGLKNINRSHEEMKPVMMKALKEMFPNLPSTDDQKSLKWLYSQVHKGYPDSPGSVRLNDSPPLVLGGDAFTQSNFDGCIQSAKSIVTSISNVIKSSS